LDEEEPSGENRIEQERAKAPPPSDGPATDEVFWLEEERVVSEDWVVRYHNRLLKRERPEPALGAGQES